MMRGPPAERTEAVAVSPRLGSQSQLGPLMQRRRDHPQRDFLSLTCEMSAHFQVATSCLPPETPAGFGCALSSLLRRRLTEPQIDLLTSCRSVHPSSSHRAAVAVGHRGMLVLVLVLVPPLPDQNKRQQRLFRTRVPLP